MNTIFISIASFIDTDLRNTILSCINQAKYPENLSFGVVLQYNNEEETNKRCIDDLIEKYNIRIKKYWFEESQGGCWARNKVQGVTVGCRFCRDICTEHAAGARAIFNHNRLLKLFA